MNAARILESVRKLRTLVVGDVCLDRWCHYDPALSEPSRETGIPRIAVTGTTVTPGAAGTVANNLKALGVASVAVLGALGEDGFGWELERGLRDRAIDAGLCVRSPELQTFTYTKLIHAGSGVEDRPRVDFINSRPMPAGVEREICRRLRQAIDDYDVVLISDQAETDAGGVVTAAVREIAAAARSALVWVDSRLRPELFDNVTVKGNREEIGQAEARSGLRAAELMRRRNWPLLMITEGPGGVSIVSRDGVRRIETRAVDNPVDICGAGDSFSAGAALALRVTGSAEDAARFGNLVASVTIMKPGTGTASPQEVLDAAR